MELVQGCWTGTKRMIMTQQRKCRCCQWPLLERPDYVFAIGGFTKYQWFCPHCGWASNGAHHPRVHRYQHRIVALLRVLWKEIRCQQ